MSVGDPVEAGAPAAAPGDARSCPVCAAPVGDGDRFCEACGSELGMPVSDQPPAPTCPDCGGAVAQDGYCTQCGARLATERDHFVEQPASWVAGVCDRGIRHPRNEDALALHALAEPGSHAVLVVCDGVSSSTDSDVAALAAARAARDVLAVSDPQALGTPDSRTAATVRALERAADAADDAVVANTTATTGNPASCTFVAAVVEGPLLVVGWVGDSRAYWLPDSGEPRLLSVDDSFAAEQIADGVPRADAENGPQAHAITRWLGVDAPDHTPRTTTAELTGPGWVLLCSDGLWNYCSAPGDVAELTRTTAQSAGAEPLGLASALVDWAKAQGGRDNITVALARVPAEGEGRTPDGNVLS